MKHQPDVELEYRPPLFPFPHQALTLVTGYLVAVVFFWTDKSSQVLGRLSVPVWLVAAAGLAGQCGRESLGQGSSLCKMLCIIW